MNERPHGTYRSVFRPGLFDGQRVWVTGGGSGIGRCVAHELAALGAQVILSGRTAEKLERVAAEVAEDGGQCGWRAFDIRDEDAVKANIADVLKDGPVNGLVNNAGGQFPSPMMAISKRGFDAVVFNMPLQATLLLGFGWGFAMWLLVAIARVDPATTLVQREVSA